jgi:hypothetical protein
MHWEDHMRTLETNKSNTPSHERLRQWVLSYLADYLTVRKEKKSITTRHVVKLGTEQTYCGRQTRWLSAEVEGPYKLANDLCPECRKATVALVDLLVQRKVFQAFTKLEPELTGRDVELANEKLIELRSQNKKGTR